MPPKHKPSGWWDIRFFKRFPDDDPNEVCPGLDFLRNDGKPAATKLIAILQSVASAPPPTWSGGGTWEAMKGDMAGYYEVRTRIGGYLYRLFCFLERDVEGLSCPSIVVVTGLRKKNLTAFRPADYAKVRALGEEYRRRIPRSVV
ncbi:MAG: hypothetical protein ACOX87_04010 [Chloroflexota bacterium]|jgi:hypothetical protein